MSGSTVLEKKIAAARAAQPPAVPIAVSPTSPEASPDKPRFEFIDSADFLTADYRQRFLIPRVLVADQPAVVAGPSKAMKTSLVVDMAVSLAAPSPFLGRFDVPVPARVAVVSGESGAATLQETAWRVIKSKGLDPKAVSHRLKWCFDLPRFPDAVGMTEFAELLLGLNVAVVFIDPLYLCLGSAIDATNMFHMGEAFRVVADKLLSRGVTPILIHHANCQLRTGDPMELQHLAYSGLEQFARQFILINRREMYRGDGVHDLWVSAGGSAGHGGLWAVHVEEGTVDENFCGREWNVTVQTTGEAQAERADEREAARDERERKKLQKEEADLLAAIDSAVSAGRDATRTDIAARFPRLKGRMLDEAARRLIDSGEIECVECVAAGGGGGAKQRAKGYRRTRNREL